MPFVVKNTTYPSLLDLVAPHSCQGCHLIGLPLCNNCKNYIIECHADHCPKCKEKKNALCCPNCPDLPPTFTITSRNELLGTLIHALKYDSIRALAHPIAEIMDAVAPDFAHIAPNAPISSASITAPTSPISSSSTSMPTSVHIVPLPTIMKHIRTRGLDHTLLIARLFARLRGYHLSPILIRAKDTVQVGSDRERRLSQATSAYALSPKAKIDPKATYILMDDVWTTGASLMSAYRLLHSAGAKNIIIFPLTYSER